MSTVKEIYETMCRLAPPELQMSFDNAGFLLGHGLSEVDRALLALDVTDDVIDEALSMDAELIISHHPLIFQPLKSMTDDSAAGRRLLKLAENRIAVISMHTNLDNAEGGVNGMTFFSPCSARSRWAFWMKTDAAGSDFCRMRRRWKNSFRSARKNCKATAFATGMPASRSASSRSWAAPAPTASGAPPRSAVIPM